MRKCKCIKESDYGIKLGQIYYYEIDDSSYFYPYNIFSLRNSTISFATFSKEYFNLLFVDIKNERKLKLEKIHEK